MARISNNRLRKSVIFAFAIFAGSLAPDILDHILIRTGFQYDYGKGWAHSILGYLLLLMVWSGAYLLRHHIKRLVLK